MNVSTDKPAGMNRKPAAILTARRRFQNACRCLPADRPPVWLMRQAGRALPEYRKLKETYTFVQLVQNPELAVEVTFRYRSVEHTSELQSHSDLVCRLLPTYH